MTRFKLLKHARLLPVRAYNSIQVEPRYWTKREATAPYANFSAGTFRLKLALSEIS